MRKAAKMFAAKSPTTRTALSCFRIIETGVVAPPALIEFKTRQMPPSSSEPGEFSHWRTIPAVFSAEWQFSFSMRESSHWF
jgi:hypothetical protein